MKLCPECRSPLARNDPTGLCAACLFPDGARTEVSTLARAWQQRRRNEDDDRLPGGGDLSHPAKSVVESGEAGVDSKQVLTRFNHERQAVAEVLLTATIFQVFSQFFGPVMPRNPPLYQQARKVPARYSEQFRRLPERKDRLRIQRKSRFALKRLSESRLREGAGFEPQSLVPEE